MMSQSAPFTVLVAALLINTLSYCSAKNVYCVTPTATSCSSCPHTSTHCATLSEYAQEAEMYFTSNTTIVFLPGDHTLDVRITVANVTRLTMHGESSSGSKPTVVRNGSVGFSFMNVADFSVYSLAFTSFKNPYYFISFGSHPASNFALGLQSTQNAKLVNCSFHDNLGTALTVHNTSVILAENEFIHNQCRCQLFSKLQKFGCGITAFNSNLTFMGNTSFHKNSAVGFLSCWCAGVIWASVSSLNFTGTSNFIDNLAYSPNSGVISATKHTSLHFTGMSNFNNNSGCAMYTSSNVVITFKGTSNFINNSAQFEDGVIHAETNISIRFTGITDFTHNSAVSGGAIYATDNILLTFNGTTNFFNNTATFGGGAINAKVHISLSFIGTSSFTHNLAEFGGAINIAENVVLTFNKTSKFFNNSAKQYGGAIHASDGTVFISSGNSKFFNNHVNSLQLGNGGAISASQNAILTFTGISNFFNNSGTYGGGAISANGYISLSFIGTSNFTNNRAKIFGGAIDIRSNAVLKFSDISNFFNNSAKQYGGAISASQSVVGIFIGANNFIGNSAKGNGGAFIAVVSVSLRFMGTSNFTSNSAESGGAVGTARNVVLTFTGANNFINNSANSDGGAIFALVNISLDITGTSNFSSNSAMQGGAISANVNSTLTFNGSIKFTNNGHNTDMLRDSHGGAMYLAISSTFSIMPHATIFWENNHATLGGAIYILNVNPFIYCTVTRVSISIPREKCFFQVTDQTPSNGLNAQLIFKNNSAGDAGSMLYGGAVDNCELTGLNLHNSGRVFDMLVHNEDDDTTSSISSDPFRICSCEDNNPNCHNSNRTFFIYPGETFQVSVAAVGQRDGIVPAAIGSRMDRGRLSTFQYVQQTTKTCTVLNYTVFSKEDVSMELYPNGPCSTHSNKLSLQLKISQSCPPGFSLDESSCICEQTLQKYTNHCNITNGLGQVTRDSDDRFWAGYDHSQRLVIVHPHCPFDFCVSHRVSFPLNSTLSDVQCAYNRSGFLCGACNNKGYSLVLGSSQCKQCTNIYILLLIPFATMGVALVFLLLVCKLTVSIGTLSGLVFYANIVGANSSIFLPVKSTDVLSLFIAWINLDFGIETCFYDGMDAYSKTWLQFVFPVYIWVLVGLMILISHYSMKFASMLGNNPVSVLATLILLSYTKILRTLIATFYFTELECQIDRRRVWLYDANIDYLVGKHIPLFLVAVLVFLLLFPYTLLLFFGQWLQAISHLKFFSWVNSARLKPFMDSYHAPYKAKHRYWPGLLLVLRFVLLLVFALNPRQDPNINLLAILLGAGFLQLWAWASGGVYKNWCLDALEGFFALNLIMLAAATYYVEVSKGNKIAVGYTSVSIAQVAFIGILTYHIFQQLRHTKLWKKMAKVNFKFKKLNDREAVDNLNNHINDPTESVNLNQLREPWLEDLLQPTHSSF